MKIKIALAEDDNMLAKTIIEKLSFFDDLNFKFRASNGNELVARIKENHNIDVILMDIQMPKKNGIEATEIINNKYPHIKIIMFTVFDDDKNIFNAIKSGANGYLLKDAEPDILHKSILAVVNGGAAMMPSIASKALNLLRNPLEISDKDDKEKVTLSHREKEILELLSNGFSYKKIATNLLIATKTVNKHIENIYKKLKVHNKLEAVLKGRKHKLI
jgi:DNA-binding NarL/FixJ family response regulator